MNILLDTCTYIWFRTEPEKLSKKARDIITDGNNTLFFSAISLWELNIKVKIGKLETEGNIEQLTTLTGYEDSIKSISFRSEDAQKLAQLTLHHKDPFDLMLICQAVTNDFRILTPDKYIRKYQVKTVW